jgi:hypothetical protein
MAKLKKLKVVFLSLVKKPANKLDIVYKSADGKFTDEKEIKITKSSPEGMVYGTVYEPNVKDAHGDWADKETIRDAAHNFILKGALGNVDENHDEKQSGARVVESYINEKGAWEVGIKMDPSSETFQKITKGELKGLSMGAFCEKSEEEPPKTDDQDSEISKTLKGIQESFSKLNERLDKIEKSVDKVPKSRQISIEGNTVKIEKDGEEPAFQEFNFNKLD